jgi:adenosylhomocysteine nucleosidase
MILWRIESAMSPPVGLPCILFALRREALPFRHQLGARQRYRAAPCWAARCGPAASAILVLETGIGAARTRAALDWLLPACQPRVIVSAGFCGGLQEGLKVGDVLVATAVADTAGQHWPTTWPGNLCPEKARLHLLRGELLTVPRLLTHRTEKRDLGNRHGATAVDMEGAVVAARCAGAGVPFGCVRAVSDDVHTSLSPRLASLVAAGRVSAPRLLATLVRAPSLVIELTQLARHTRQAAHQLGQALAWLLQAGNGPE